MVRLECVPNISEGRRRDVIDACVEAASTRGVRVLDVSSDPDHNRTVLTLLGAGGDLVRAVTALAGAAIERIDVAGHSGVHPFLGALDVAPFVPLEAQQMPAAVDAALRAADELAALGLPVFLYGEAASNAGRAALADHRRGGLARLGERMASGEWPPDRGLSRPHTTGGVVCIGARKPLVAFNLLLDTDQLVAAKRIASALRESGGGLPGVRALGFFLESRQHAQVSVNLTDCDRTSLLDVVRRADELAAAAGVRVVETELVGLAPRRVLPEGGAAALRLRELSDRQTLESHL
ncbi:MAG: glutamate formimidoyltransferase [Acidobacteriota bacterium]|nr:glutamate formimidoyltransferase [Acidobacteriota bacterium]MDE3266506.1 glutamate formimidoyltransferase [Acidobacteriota bacterium]